MTSRWASAGTALALLVWASACRGRQSALTPRGPQAQQIEMLWWVLLGVSIAVFVLVVAFLFYAMYHRPAQAVDRGAARHRRMWYAVGLATAATVVILVGLTFVSTLTGSRLSRAPREALEVEVIGHQWWWEVRYSTGDPSEAVTTANELRIPVGRPVKLQLKSRDVIHSFWVPNLHGKIDMVPGRTNHMWFQADEAGQFRGQCAEFCGIQHAMMAFWVVALQERQFEQWMARQRMPAPEPADDQTRLGKHVLESACVACHTVRGTRARATVGPDLTHVAGRLSLAAGALQNNRGSLAAWIADPQQIKPGSRMPPMNLEPERLHALLAYLETLQ